jgi:hypothetical protein
VKSKITLWLVALVTFGPFVIASIVYYGPWGRSWLPQLAGSRVLLETAVPLPAEWHAANPERRWTLLYARTTPCTEQCAAHVLRFNQVHHALNRNQDRAQRILLHVGAAPRIDDALLIMHSLDEPEASDLAAALDPAAMAAGRLYVADPEGNVILSYPAEIEQRELLRDLRRLMSASGEGS